MQPGPRSLHPAVGLDIAQGQLYRTSGRTSSAPEHVFSGADPAQTAAPEQQLRGSTAKRQTAGREETVSSLGAAEVLGSVVRRFGYCRSSEFVLLVWKWVEGDR